MDHPFGGVIWTNHALDRLRERGIKQGDAWATWRNPQASKKGKSGNFVYYRNWNGTQIEVVAKRLPAQAGNEKGEWIILSVWSRPVITPKFPKFPKSPNSKKVSFWRWLYNQLF